MCEACGAGASVSTAAGMQLGPPCNGSAAAARIQRSTAKHFSSCAHSAKHCEALCGALAQVCSSTAQNSTHHILIACSCGRRRAA
jgi:hypothetical protein